MSVLPGAVAARGRVGSEAPSIPGLVRRSAGFGLLELVVLLCVAVVLVTLLARGVLYYEERAERAAVELLLEQMRKGLQIQMTELIFSNRQAQVADLEVQEADPALELKPRRVRGPW